ncbi:MAG: polyprenyl synthetase family protein [Planctomycetota bacterium]
MKRHSSTAAETIIDESLHQPVTDFIRCRGKRIRGSLIQLAFAMGGGSGDVPPTVVEAVECLHAGSLVIDDIQDDSSQRRDRPAMHRQIGIPLSINAGNWMYFHSLEMLSVDEDLEKVRCDMVAAMIHAAKVCHEGQALDLASRVDEVDPADWHAIVHSISDQKTGTLVGLAMKLGAIAAGANRNVVLALENLGTRIGIALQMRNDLGELIESAQPVARLDNGDSRQDDLRNARVTWPWAWLTREADAAVCQRLAASLGNADSHGLRIIAAEVLSPIKEVGNHELQSLIEQAIRIVSEQVIDAGLLGQLRKALSPIHAAAQKTTIQKAAVEGIAT